MVKQMAGDLTRVGRGVGLNLFERVVKVGEILIPNSYQTVLG